MRWKQTLPAAHEHVQSAAEPRSRFKEDYSIYHKHIDRSVEVPQELGQRSLPKEPCELTMGLLSVWHAVAFGS